MIPVHIFREYDIRGEVDKDLTEGVVEEIGRAFATYLLRHLKPSAPSTQRRTVTVGRDVRLHSPRMKEALVRGINSTGIDVIDIGVCPTPLTYFSIFHFSTPTCTETPPSLPEYGSLEILGGVMITGSHNPPEFNGFKLCQGKAALYGEAIQEIGRIAGELSTKKRETVPVGKVTPYEIIPPYLQYLRDQFVTGRSEKSAPRFPIKIVVDSGNGTAGVVAPGILREMGCEVTELYSEPDGRFPNHHPDPSVLKNLADLMATVKKKKAHLGVAYDGDADRIGVIDEKGEVIWGDRLMVIFARDILREHPGATMISEVKASQVLYNEISRAGGKPIMWKAGHSLIKAKMKETGAALGGEVSGHVFFADRFFGYDDAIYATCRLVEILQKTPLPGGEREEDWGVSHLLRGLPETVVTPEIRVSCPDDQKFGVVERLQETFQQEARKPGPGAPAIKELVTVDGVRVIFDHGWGLVRPSNTQPVLVLRFEADSEERLQTYRTYVEKQLRALTSFTEQEH